MRALGVRDFGEPEVLEVFERTVREPATGEVRIRVAAAAVNPADLLMRQGSHRSAFEGFERPLVFGLDAAGTIESTGQGVQRLAVGDRVMAAVLPMRPEGGAQSELLLAPAESVVTIPDEMSFERASTLPMNAMTAVDALQQLALPEGATLAVTGGAGWLGALMLGLARERGLRTIADARPDEHELVRADDVVDRGDGLAERIRDRFPDGVDGLLDTALIGPPALAAIRDRGAVATVRPSEEVAERDITWHPIRGSRHFADTVALEHVRDLAATGRLPATVHETFAVEHAAEAHRRQAGGGIRGRLVLTF